MFTVKLWTCLRPRAPVAPPLYRALHSPAPATSTPFHIASFYHFHDFADHHHWVERYHATCTHKGLLGTIHLAPEGLNGTLAGHAADIDSFVAWAKTDPRLALMHVHWSWAPALPFARLNVRARADLLSMGTGRVDPSQGTAIHVDAEHWDWLLGDPTVTVLDTRNGYECAVGTFPGALNPGLDHFSAFPEYVGKQLDPARHRRIAMFCTGGIRCEKAGAYMLQQGFSEVYQLKGGILEYLKQKETTGGSKFHGDCFVFDARYALNQALEETHTHKIKQLEELLPGLQGRKAIRNEPTLLHRDIALHVAPVVRALCSLYPLHNVVHMVARAPRLLLHDHTHTMQVWAREVHALVGDVCVPLSVLRHEPGLLWVTPEAVAGRVGVLLRDNTRDKVRALLRACPYVLGKDLEGESA